MALKMGGMSTYCYCISTWCLSDVLLSDEHHDAPWSACKVCLSLQSASQSPALWAVWKEENNLKCVIMSRPGGCCAWPRAKTREAGPSGCTSQQRADKLPHYCTSHMDPWEASGICSALCWHFGFVQFWPLKMMGRPFGVDHEPVLFLP